MSFLFGAQNKWFYNYLYIASIIVGATTSLSMMINLIDGFFAIMAFPTMIGTIAMAPRVTREITGYIKRMKS